jgi:hypothetical protein
MEDLIVGGNFKMGYGLAAIGNISNTGGRAGLNTPILPVL